MRLLVPILKANELFADWSEDELVKMLQFCQPYQASKGEIIFREGSEDDRAVYFIETGVVKVMKGPEGQRKLLAMFGLGNWFGDMSFLTPGARSATVVADEAATLYKLLPARLLDLEQAEPYTALKLLKVFIAKLVTRLRQTDEALVRQGSEIIIT